MREMRTSMALTPSTVSDLTSILRAGSLTLHYPEECLFNLKVFASSARDYMKIRGQTVKYIM